MRAPAGRIRRLSSRRVTPGQLDVRRRQCPASCGDALGDDLKRERGMECSLKVSFPSFAVRGRKVAARFYQDNVRLRRRCVRGCWAVEFRRGSTTMGPPDILLILGVRR